MTVLVPLFAYLSRLTVFEEHRINHKLYAMTRRLNIIGVDFNSCPIYIYSCLLLLFFTSRDEPVIATFVCVENIVGPFGKQENSKSNVTPPNGLKPLIKCCFRGEKQYKYLGFNLLVNILYLWLCSIFMKQEY